LPLNAFFSKYRTFATLRLSGPLGEVNHSALALIRDELALLTLSQLGYAKRQMMGVPTISYEYPAATRSHLALNSKSAEWIHSSSAVGRIHKLTLDERWKTFQRSSFFPGLLRVLRGTAAIDKSWSADIKTAGLLIGQSQGSTDLPQAFLLNMIAFERLLTSQGDTYTEALPARTEAFLGWVSHWKTGRFSDRIRDVYKKRSAFVHAGRRDVIEPNDLYFIDDLLLNLLINIVTHTKLFPTKTAVTEFAKRVDAERLLGVRPRVRQKTLQYLERRYYPGDQDIW
jgi:hypothetical protein